MKSDEHQDWRPDKNINLATTLLIILLMNMLTAFLVSHDVVWLPGGHLFYVATVIGVLLAILLNYCRPRYDKAGNFWKPIYDLLLVQRWDSDRKKRVALNVILTIGFAILLALPSWIDWYRFVNEMRHNGFPAIVCPSSGFYYFMFAIIVLVSFIANAFRLYSGGKRNFVAMVVAPILNLVMSWTLAIVIARCFYVMYRP